MKGRIQKYFSSRKYGFIETDESEDNIFFHKSNYRSQDIPSIGQNVEFKIVETPKGNEARDIKVIKSDMEAVQEQEKQAEETLSE